MRRGLNNRRGVSLVASCQKLDLQGRAVALAQFTGANRNQNFWEAAKREVASIFVRLRPDALPAVSKL
jgi:hypothetical protein